MCTARGAGLWALLYRGSRARFVIPGILNIDVHAISRLAPAARAAIRAAPIAHFGYAQAFFGYKNKRCVGRRLRLGVDGVGWVVGGRRTDELGR